MTNADLIGRFVSGACDGNVADDARDAAIKCLVDWTGVTIAGSREPVTRAVARYAGLDDAATPLFANDAEPEKAALLNGTAAHALDFDDTHIPTDSHFSAVLWATLLAMTETKFDNGDRLLRAFIAGYEVAAKLSGRRMGFSLQFRWFHPSGVLGRIATAAAAAAFLALDADRAAHAVALATTQASGLRSSLGSMAKPFQIGRAAADGIVCANLARSGFDAALDLLEPDGGFARAFVQDGSAQLAVLDADTLGTDWAVLKTSFKPYACLHGIHPSIDAAREIAGEGDPAAVTAITAYVAPGVKKVGHFTDPKSPLEAKFSVAFCVALALSGREAGAADFTADIVADPTLRRLTALVDVRPEEGRKMLDSEVEVTLQDGQLLRGATDLSRGHPGNPMDWADLGEKFITLSEPVLHDRALPLLKALREFDSPGALPEIARLLRS
jgi:2-methylcitrate dehydratase PrpD